MDFTTLVITKFQNLLSSNFPGNEGSHFLHHGVDFLRSFHSLQGDGNQFFLIITVLFKQLLHPDQKCFSAVQVPGCRITKRHHRRHGVLISCKGSLQTTIAFFIAEDELMAVVFLEMLDLFSDIFESRQGFDPGYAIFLRQRDTHFSGNDGRYHRSVFRQRPLFFFLGKDIIKQNRPRHVPGKAFIGAYLAVSDINAQPVRIRIRRQDQIGTDAFCQFQCQCKCSGILRIRIGDGRKVSIRRLLLLHHIDVFEAEFLQDPPDPDISRPMKRSINNL